MSSTSCKIWLPFRFVLLAGWLAACSAGCNRQTENARAVFRYNESAGISTLDPAFSRSQALMWPAHQLFNTLVETDSSLRTVPSLARHWTVSTNRMSIRFTLRGDVFFHDDACFPGGKGRRMTAADVIFSLQRITDPATASPGAWIFHDRLDGSRPFVLVSDSVFDLNLSRPFQPIFGILAMKYCSIVAPEAVKMYGRDFGRHPVGTGPFQLLSWRENEVLLMKRNPRYFEFDEAGVRLPYLEAIRIDFAESKLSEFLAFRQGRIDFLNDIDASVKDELLTKTGKLKPAWAGSIVMRTCHYLNTEYLGILAVKDSDDKLADPRVRKAIGHAINRRKMLMYLRNSIGTPAEAGFVPPGLPGALPMGTGLLYNPARADSLLREAGVSSVSPLRIRLITVPNYAALGTFIVNELRQLGIDAEVEVAQKSVLLDKMSAGQVPFFRGSWIADYPDAENYLSVFFGPNPAPPNYTRYRNASFDESYLMSVSEPDDDKRFALYRKMDSTVMADVPVIPLWYDQVLHFYQPTVTGIRPNPLNLLELRRTKKAS